MNPQEFTKRWIEGMKNLTPSQQLQAKMYGNIGAVLGLVIALVAMFIQGIWYWIVFLIFITFLQALELYKVSQQLTETRKFEREMQNLQYAELSMEEEDGYR